MMHARKKQDGASCYLVSPGMDMNQALAFSKEDLHSLCDYGLYNAVIAGYLAMPVSRKSPLKRLARAYTQHLIRCLHRKRKKFSGSSDR